MYENVCKNLHSITNLYKMTQNDFKKNYMVCSIR